jgi:putative DNA primase/helicase
MTVIKIHTTKNPSPQPKKSTLEALLALAKNLNKDTADDEVKLLLQKTANATLALIAEDEVLTAISKQTGANFDKLKQVLSLYQLMASGASHDEPLALALRVLANSFNDGTHLIRCMDGCYWRFNGRHWQETTGDAISKLLLTEATKSPTDSSSLHRLVSSAKKTLDIFLATEEDVLGFNDDPEPVVNCSNGEVWIDKQGKPELRPHRPDSRLTSCLETMYDAAATCPTFDAALLQIFAKASNPHDVVRHWHEFVGYAIQPRRDIASFWLLHGDGSNGKSKLLETMQKLVGSQAIENISIAKFQGDRFNVASLPGKLMLIDDDIGSDTHLDDGLLKMISEAKAMTTRHAYGERKFRFKCLALPIMAGNPWPTTSDDSHGFRRRAQVIPFDRIFSKSEADKEIFPKIWASELPGILNRALEGLARLRQRGDFMPPLDCVRAAHEFMANANPLDAFLEDEIVLDQEGHIFLHDFRQAMTKWASQQGLKKPVPYKALKRALESRG